MSETGYMVDCEGDSSEYFATLAEAEEYAAEYEATLRANAQSDGEWPEDTAVRVYALLSESVVQDLGEGLHDYTRRATGLTPDLVADLRRQRNELRAALERIAGPLEEEYDGQEFEVTFGAAQEIARAALARCKP